MANAKILAGSHMDHVGAMQSVKPLHTDLFVSAQLGGPEIPTLNASPVSEIWKFAKWLQYFQKKPTCTSLF